MNMKHNYFLVVFAAVGLFFCNSAKGQLVSDDVFLQGRYLEVAVAPNGSWGNTVNPPAGYHTASGGATYSYTDPITGTTASSTTSMDFQYNVSMAGWGVAGTGGIPFYGPHYLPGTPFDGWSVQVNGVREDAFYNNGGFTGTLTGTNTGYIYAPASSVGSCSFTPGTVTSVWQGTAAGGNLAITQYNRVDTLSSWDVVTVIFKNTTATTLNGVYYFATADPDNDEVTTGGSFPTNNHIYYQGDARHRVMVEARPPSIHQDAYSSLCTRDCRAKCLIYQSWPPSLTAGNNLDLIYAGTATGIGTSWYVLGNTTYDQDIAYGLIYNLGNLAPHDSAIVSFAWNFKDSTCTDSAFPDPVLVLNCIQSTVVDDTFLSCAHPGMTTLPVDIRYGNEKDWSWGSWTWSPSTGLSATTGTDVTVNINALTGPVTYTVTGNDSVSGMHSCNTTVLYFTVIPCFGATNNSAICDGDVLHLDAIGDSVGATYEWFTPGGTLFSTLHHVVISPSTYADSGTWKVVRIIGTEYDTATTHVVIRWKPVLTLSTNAPLCYGMVDTLTLNAVPDSAGETFAWTGPAGFTSTLVNPTIPGFTAADTGFYQVIATSSFGCKDTARIDAGVLTQPPTPTVSGVTSYCSGDPFVPFTVTGATGTVLWYTVGTGGVGSTTAPTVNTSYGGTYTFWVAQNVGGCISLRDSITVKVVVTPAPPVITGTSTYCQGDTYVPPTTAGTNVLWYITPTGGTGTTTPPTISTASVGVYTIYATQSDSGCTSARGSFVITVNVLPAPPTITGITTYCQNDVPVPFSVGGIIGTEEWFTSATGGVGSTTPTPINTATAGVTTYWVGQTLGGCTSARADITVTVHPTPATPDIVGDSVYCQYDTYIPPTAAPSGTGVIHWFSELGIGGGSLTPPNVSTLLPGSVTIYATQTDSGCTSLPDSFLITINPQPLPPYIIDSPGQYCPGQTFVPFDVVSGTAVTWYTVPTGGTGSTTAPAVNTVHPGTYYFWATQTVAGCTSPRAMVSVEVYDSVKAAFTDVVKLGCAGDSVTFTNTSSGATAYEWKFGDGYMSNLVNPLHIYYTQGLFNVTLYAHSATCKDSITQHISLVHPLNASISVTPKDSVCQGSPLNFTSATSAISPTYVWAFGDGGTATGASTPYTYMHSGIYVASLTVTDFVPCSITVTQPIFVDTISPIHLLMTDSVFCQGTFATFTGLFASFGNKGVKWNFGDGYNDSSNNENPVRYGFSYPDSFLVTVTALYSACPETSASHKVWVMPQPSLNLGADTTICPGGNPVVLSDKINYGNPNATWKWSNGAKTSSISVGAPGVYVATVDVRGCYTSDSVIVTSDCYMDIPNAFTPNGDGINDYFYPRQYLTKGLMSFAMNIYNRWGELIFTTNTTDGRGWDGRFNNVDQPEGVYIFKIEATFIDGQKEQHQGNITLLR